MAPYFINNSLPIPELISDFNADDLPLVFDALIAFSKQQALPQLEDEIRQFQGWEIAQRERQARDQPPEIRAILEGAGRPRVEIDEESHPSEGPSKPRFAITSLRQALNPVASTSLPINRQRELERAALEAARMELAHSEAKMRDRGLSATGDASLQREKLQAWMHGWLGVLTKRITIDIQALKERVESETKTRPDDGTPGSHKTKTMKEAHQYLYLSLLSPDKLALITILEVMRNVGSGGVTDGMKALRGMLGVGRAVETEYRAETIKNVAGVDSTQWLRTIDQSTQKPSRTLVGQQWKRIGRQLDNEGRSLSAGQEQVDSDFRSVWTPSWSHAVSVDIGAFLLKALIETARIDRTATDPRTGDKV